MPLADGTELSSRTCIGTPTTPPLSLEYSTLSFEVYIFSNPTSLPRSYSSPRLPALAILRVYYSFLISLLLVSLIRCILEFFPVVNTENLSSGNTLTKIYEICRCERSHVTHFKVLVEIILS